VSLALQSLPGPVVRRVYMQVVALTSENVSLQEQLESAQLRQAEKRNPFGMLAPHAADASQSVPPSGGAGSFQTGTSPGVPSCRAGASAGSASMAPSSSFFALPPSGTAVAAAVHSRQVSGGQPQPHAAMAPHAAHHVAPASASDSTVAQLQLLVNVLTVQLQEQVADKEAALAAQRAQKEMLAARIAELEARFSSVAR
jgi:hypothetical protein